jgi:hypothetical protein
MQLNQGQQAASEAVFSFLMSDSREFNISGPAGVGKTFMMKHIMDTLLKEYEAACLMLGQKPVNYSVVLTATTNKAAEVLQEATGYPVFTIHSHMNLKVQDDYATGQSKITKTTQWVVHNNQIIFVDEASMVDQKLHKLILEGTDKTCKIIYIGDHCQMAPVMETISPVYSTPMHFVQLTEPVRNADQPALQAICSQARDTVETLQFRPIQPVPGVIDYVTDEEAVAWIDQTFKTETLDERVLCYTNTRVQEYNEYIRNLRGYPDLLTQGEIVINNSAFAVGGMMLRVEQDVIVTDVLSKPYMKAVDPDDSFVQLELYDLLITPLKGKKADLKVSVPANPEHYKSLLRYYAGRKKWAVYYNIKNGHPDLRAKAAATVYKAQGSTYDTVFLDLTNIGKCTQADQVARMLYVGLSRAKNRILLHGQLPPRYLGA